VLRSGLHCLMSKSEQESACCASTYPIPPFTPLQRTGSVRISLSTVAVTCCGDQEMKKVSPHNSFGFFNRAFLVGVTPLDRNIGGLDAAPYHMVVMMYNLGLAFHCLAASNGNSNMLRKALRLYEGCFAHLRHCTAAPSSCLLVLKLALANNIGHVHSHFFQTTRAQECAGFISSLLPCAKQTLALAQGEARDTEEVAFFIAHSVLFHHDNSFLFAAAA